MSLPLVNANSIQPNSINISAKFNLELSNNNGNDQSHGTQEQVQTHNQSQSRSQDGHSPKTSLPLPPTTSTSISASIPSSQPFPPMEMEKERGPGIPTSPQNQSQFSFSFSWENNRASKESKSENADEESKWGLNVRDSTRAEIGRLGNYNYNSSSRNYLTTSEAGKEENKNLNNNSTTPTSPPTSGWDELLSLQLHKKEVDGSQTLSSSLFPPGQAQSHSHLRESVAPGKKSPCSEKVWPSSSSSPRLPPTPTPAVNIELVGQPRTRNPFEIIPWESGEELGDGEIKRGTVTLQFFSASAPSSPASPVPGPGPSPNSKGKKSVETHKVKIPDRKEESSLTSTVLVTRSPDPEDSPPNLVDLDLSREEEGRRRVRKYKKVDFQIPGEMDGKLKIIGMTESSSTGGWSRTLETVTQAQQIPVTPNEELEESGRTTEQEVENRSDKSRKKQHVTTSSSAVSNNTNNHLANTGTTDAGTKKGAQSQLTSTSVSVRRRSRSPTNNIMREIRKMSLASQDAKEEKKKAAAGGGVSGGSGGGGGGSGGGGGGGSCGTSGGGSSGSSTFGPGASAAAKKAAKRLNRRRKRREEEYTDKDRAAAVTLGSRDIKQSLKAKKKRERKLHISIDLLHSEDFLSAMFVVEAAYQMRVKKQTSAALITLNKALELQPTHKAALVARSQCHLKLGDAASALRDAETSFEGNETYIMGLYQYAEALYNLGQFEKALIAYHRGYRIRKVESFRIGIQKSQEAIRRAIGDRSATQIEDLDEILPLIDEQEALANLKQEHGSICPAADDSSGVPNTGGATTNIGLGGGVGVGAGAGGSCMRSGTGNKHKAPSKSRARWVAREVLGQMYFDKDYLTKFLHRPDIQSDQGAFQEELRSNASEALNYLEIREQFWRQQNPMYARKQGLNFNSKMVLQAEHQQQTQQQERERERERHETARRRTLEIDGPVTALAAMGKGGVRGGGGGGGGRDRPRRSNRPSSTDPILNCHPNPSTNSFTTKNQNLSPSSDTLSTQNSNRNRSKTRISSARPNKPQPPQSPKRETETDRGKENTEQQEPRETSNMKAESRRSTSLTLIPEMSINTQPESTISKTSRTAIDNHNLPIPGTSFSLPSTTASTSGGKSSQSESDLLTEEKIAELLVAKLPLLN